MRDLTNYHLKSIEDITEPKAGKWCYGPSWWIVTPDRQVLFFHGGKRRRMGSPQCNPNKTISEHIQKRMYQDCTVELIPMAYLTHDCDN